MSINEGYLATWGAVAAPIGGWKQSGIGRRHGREGLLKYTEAQTIADEREGRMTRPRHMSERGWAEMEQVLVRTR